jgi:hypothetical protein
MTTSLPRCVGVRTDCSAACLLACLQRLHLQRHLHLPSDPGASQRAPGLLSKRYQFRCSVVMCRLNPVPPEPCAP